LLPTGRGANPALHLDRAREEEIFTTLAQVDRDEFGYDWDVHEMFACDLWDCERILYSTVVDSVGRVHPCVAIRHVLGDVHHDNLSAIWQKQRATYSKESLSPWAGQGVCYCRLFSQESSAVERLIEVR
jgi:MoaA/NifB/PqqE/SkfB family radical SAM enzyme